VSPRRALAALVAAGGCAVTAALVWLAAYHIAPFEAIDHRTFDGFLGLSRPATTGWALRGSHLADPGPFALFAAALVIAALARRRARTAGAVALILLGSNVTTQVLKPALAMPPGFPGMETATWPSGHATAAMALGLCLVLVAPVRLRPLAAAAGGLFALAVASSVLILGNHQPSDVIGGFLVAGAWAGLAVAGLRAFAADRDPALRIAAALRPSVLAAGGLAVAVGALALAHGREALDYAAGHTTFMAGAAVIAAGAMGMAGAAALALTRR